MAGQDSGAALGEERHQHRKGAEWALGQALTRPLSHPPQASLDARCGSQGQSPACLGLVAGSNSLGPEIQRHPFPPLG